LRASFESETNKERANAFRCSILAFAAAEGALFLGAGVAGIALAAGCETVFSEVSWASIAGTSDSKRMKAGSDGKREEKREALAAMLFLPRNRLVDRCSRRVLTFEASFSSRKKQLRIQSLNLTAG
jgi:hypothetical protein